MRRVVQIISLSCRTTTATPQTLGKRSGCFCFVVFICSEHFEAAPVVTSDVCLYSEVGGENIVYLFIHIVSELI